MSQSSKKKSKNAHKQVTENTETVDDSFAASTDGLSVGNRVIPVIEEFAAVSKEIVETGKVNVSKKIREYEETIDEPLFQEQVKVERVPINKFVEASPQIRKEGQTTIIPVVEERLIVEKRLFVVEEIHVSKELFQLHEPKQITLRKEEVEITRLPTEQSSS